MSEHKYPIGQLGGPVLFMDLSGVAPYTNFDTVVCLRQLSPKDSVAVIDSSSNCGPDKQPGIADYSISGTGIHLIDPTTGKVSGTSLRAALRAKVRCGFKICPPPATIQEDDEIEIGTCFVQELSSTYDYNNPAEFSFTLQPYGTSTITYADVS